MLVLEFKSVFARDASKLTPEVPAEELNFICAHTTVGIQILKIRQCDCGEKFEWNSFYISIYFAFYFFGLKQSYLLGNLH